MSRKHNSPAPKKREHVANTHYHVRFDPKSGGWRIYEGSPTRCFLCKKPGRPKGAKR